MITEQKAFLYFGYEICALSIFQMRYHMSVFKNALPENGQRSTTCGNWIADIYRRIVDADIAFVNVGGLRTDLPVEEGEISRTIRRSDLYTVFPFDNAIYCYEITGEELLQVFEYSLASAGKGLISQVIGMNVDSPK